MTQLILDTTGYNMILPESIKGGYVVEEQALSVEVEMITGRIVRQLRGNAWHITYQYGFFDDDTKNKLISVCRKGKEQAITCGFLPPDSSGTLLYSNFLVMAFTYPKFMWSQMLPGENGDTARPLWGDFSLELREVRPHD